MLSVSAQMYLNRIADAMPPLYEVSPESFLSQISKHTYTAPRTNMNMTVTFSLHPIVDFLRRAIGSKANMRSVDIIIAACVYDHPRISAFEMHLPSSRRLKKYNALIGAPHWNTVRKNHMVLKTVDKITAP